jgi:hypothetical protein
MAGVLAPWSLPPHPEQKIVGWNLRKAESFVAFTYILIKMMLFQMFLCEIKDKVHKYFKMFSGC